jgi:hypothetical protein
MHHPAPEARLLTLPREGLPGWCDRYLAPPGAGDVFAGRAFLDSVLRAAIPEGATPLLAEAGGVLLTLMRGRDGGLGSLTTPYTLAWRPLLAEAAPREAGRALGRLLRGQTVRLEALDPEAPGLAAFRAGLSEARLIALPFAHFGNWHEALPADTRWSAYLAARPPTLRTTITRKLHRAARDFTFESASAPGPALEAGIVAYEAVRAGSWKPEEPHPDFDATLMRAMAALGALRFGVLRDKAGAPVAAQYWVVDGGRAWVLKLSHLESAKATSPGTALTAMMIRTLLDEDGVRELDFGRGDDEYKKLWVAHRRQRIGLLLADPLHPTGLAAIARHLAGRAMRRLRGAR